MPRRGVRKYLPGAIVEENPMARTLAELPAGSRITDYISLGVIAKFFPTEKIHEVLEQTKRTSVRERDLPAHVVVYYVIALALYIRSPDLVPIVFSAQGKRNAPEELQNGRNW